MLTRASRHAKLPRMAEKLLTTLEIAHELAAEFGIKPKTKDPKKDPEFSAEILKLKRRVSRHAQNYNIAAAVEGTQARFYTRAKADKLKQLVRDNQTG